MSEDHAPIGTRLGQFAAESPDAVIGRLPAQADR